MLGIGLDYHGVIIESSRHEADEDRSLEALIARKREHAGMFAGVTQLIEVSCGNVWIVSKAGVHMEKAISGWLEKERFFARTGMAADHLRFCRERGDKAPICRDLRLTHFVDDRIHLMQILRYEVPCLFLFGEPDRKRFCPPWARYVSSWPDLVGAIVGR